jgi:hypothetical protein
MKIIITTPNNFSKEDKSELIKQGICVIEAKNPDKVKIVADVDFGDTAQVMFAALDALRDSGHHKQEFFDSLAKRLKKKDE